MRSKAFTRKVKLNGKTMEAQPPANVQVTTRPANDNKNNALDTHYMPPSANEVAPEEDSSFWQ